VLSSETLKQSTTTTTTTTSSSSSSSAATASSSPPYEHLGCECCQCNVEHAKKTIKVIGLQQTAQRLDRHDTRTVANDDDDDVR
jgi:hypothetical protein